MGFCILQSCQIIACQTSQSGPPQTILERVNEYFISVLTAVFYMSVCPVWLLLPSVDKPNKIKLFRKFLSEILKLGFSKVIQDWLSLVWPNNEALSTMVIITGLVTLQVPSDW